MRRPIIYKEELIQKKRKEAENATIKNPVVTPVIYIRDKDLIIVIAKNTSEDFNKIYLFPGNIVMAAIGLHPSIELIRQTISDYTFKIKEILSEKDISLNYLAWSLSRFIDQALIDYERFAIEMFLAGKENKKNKIYRLGTVYNIALHDQKSNFGVLGYEPDVEKIKRYLEQEFEREKDKMKLAKKALDLREKEEIFYELLIISDSSLKYKKGKDEIFEKIKRR